MNIYKAILFYLLTFVVANGQQMFGCTDPQAINFNYMSQLDDGSCEYEFELGDVNQDYNINVLDIVLMIRFILLDAIPSPYELWASDMNGDGVIGPEDVPLIVVIILNPPFYRMDRIKSIAINTEIDKIRVLYSGPVASVLMRVSGDYNINESSIPFGWNLKISTKRDLILLYNLNGSSLNTDILMTYTGTLSLISGSAGDWLGNREIASINQYKLTAPYPNPFNGATKIEFYSPTGSNVSIEVFDLQGHSVGIIGNSFYVTGFHSISWTPNSLPSGVYLIRLEASGQLDTQRIIYLK
jgi:hypothetical protein